MNLNNPKFKIFKERGKMWCVQHPHGGKLYFPSFYDIPSLHFVGARTWVIAMIRSMQREQK